MLLLKMRLRASRILTVWTCNISVHGPCVTMSQGKATHVELAGLALHAFATRTQLNFSVLQNDVQRNHLARSASCRGYFTITQFLSDFLTTTAFVDWWSQATFSQSHRFHCIIDTRQQPQYSTNRTNCQPYAQATLDLGFSGALTSLSTAP